MRLLVTENSNQNFPAEDAERHEDANEEAGKRRERETNARKIRAIPRQRATCKRDSPMNNK